MARVFMDGFEIGRAWLWDVVAGYGRVVGATTSNVKSGTYSLRVYYNTSNSC